MYFSTEDDYTKSVILDAVSRSFTEDRRLRIDVDENGVIKVKVGEGMWTAGYASTHDPYRDVQQKPKAPEWAKGEWVNGKGEHVEWSGLIGPFPPHGTPDKMTFWVPLR